MYNFKTDRKTLSNCLKVDFYRQCDIHIPPCQGIGDTLKCSDTSKYHTLFFAQITTKKGGN